MRQLLPLALLVATSAACANASDERVGTGSDSVVGSNAALVIEGADEEFAAELYGVLRANPTAGPVEKKEVSGLACERKTVSAGNYQHRCVVSANLTEQQLGQIFAALELPTNGGVGEKAKSVGPLIVTEGANGHRVLKNDACANVPEGNVAAAQKCVAFWTKEVFSSYATPNAADVTNSAATKAQTIKQLKLQGVPTDQLALENEALFVGALFQETAKGDLAYFDVMAGRYAMPRPFFRVSLPDLRGGLTAANAKAWALGFDGVTKALANRAH